MKQFCVLLMLVVAATATSESDGLITTALKFVKDCNDKSIVLCIKERALQLVDKTEGDFEITEGIKLVQTDEPSQARSLNDVELSDDTETREQEVDSLLVDRVARFLGSHTLQFKVSKDSIKDVQRSLEEARGKGGKKSKKYLLPLLLLFKLKAAALLPLAIGFLALISFKALIIGKLALLLSGIIGLKKLLESKHSSSYEVVAHPSSHHGAYSYDEAHGAFRRSIDAQKLAFSAQKQ